jgi:hypothetical protein
MVDDKAAFVWNQNQKRSLSSNGVAGTSIED